MSRLEEPEKVDVVVYWRNFVLNFCGHFTSLFDLVLVGWDAEIETCYGWLELPPQQC